MGFPAQILSRLFWIFESSFWTWNLELIKKEGEEAAKKKKEVLAERITPLPTLNGMSKSIKIS